MEQQNTIKNRSEVATESETRRSTDRPVVGVIATPDNAKAVASTILRGKQEGYSTIVCHGGNEALEAVAFAEQLNAPVVEVDPHRDMGGSFEEELAREARGIGYPGVLFDTTPEQPVDFEASTQQLREQDTYLVEAITTTRVDSDPEILAAIPAYNEESSIGDVVQGAQKHVDEVVVIDDGSTDDTVRIAEEAGATVIEHESNKGYGGALKTAFTEAARCHADHLAILDGDGQHDSSDIKTLVDAQQESEAEIVIGSRSVAGSETDMPLYRRFGFGVVNLLTNLSMGVVRSRSRVADTQSGFRVYDRVAVSTLADEDIGNNMSASTDILHHAHKHGYAIQEVPTSISYDVDDASSHHPITHGVQLIGNLIRTIERERPLLLLGLPGFAATALGIAFAYWTFSNYLNTGSFPVSLAIIAGLFGLLGAFTSFTAIILHSLKTHLD